MSVGVAAWGDFGTDGKHWKYPSGAKDAGRKYGVVGFKKVSSRGWFEE